MTTKWHVSASQAKTARLCLRKWYYEKIEKRPTPTTAALRIGREHSEQVEQYLKGERAAEDCMGLVQIGMGLLPAPGYEFMEVEREIRMPAEFLLDYAGVPFVEEFRYGTFVGYIDLLITDPAEPEILDHKTRSDPKWALSEDGLLVDYQMNLYAAWGQTERPDLFDDKVVIGHINYLKNGKRGPRKLRAFRRDAHATRETITPVIRDVVQDTLAMIDARGSDALPPGDPTFDACRAYGGCPHQAYCQHYQDKHGARALFAQLDNGDDEMSNENEDFFNELFGSPAETPTPAETPAETPDETPAPAETPAPDDEFDQAISVLTPDAEDEFDAMLAETADPVTPEPEAEPEAGDTETWEGFPTRWQNRAPEGLTRTEAATWTRDQFLAIKGLGPGTVDEVMALLASEGTEPTPAEPALPDPVAQYAAQSSPEGIAYILCVDCAPSRGGANVVYVDDLAYLAGERATAQHGRYYMALPYNEGKVTAAEILLPMLESELRNRLAQHSRPIYVVASSRHPLWAYLTDYLHHHATLVIAG